MTAIILVGLGELMGYFGGMNDLLDDNNLFIFDDVNVRISPVSKMPFRKKPCDSMHVRSKSNMIKSLPGTVHKWLPKLQPLAKPIAKWFPIVEHYPDLSLDHRFGMFKAYDGNHRQSGFTNDEIIMASDQNSSDPAPKCQTMALNHDSLSPAIQLQGKVTQADRTITTSNELDLLFTPMFDELLNGSSKVVSKSSAVSAADAPNQRQQYTTPLNNHKTPEPTYKNFVEYTGIETQESKIDTGKAVDADLVVTKSSGIKSEVQDDNNSTADGRKPKPRISNQTSWSLPVSKSSRVTITTVPQADHSKSSTSFSDSKYLFCSTCHKCVFNANHDACITKIQKEVNSRTMIQYHKIRNNNKPVDQKSLTQKPGRPIFTGHRFSPNKTSAVYEKTSSRSDLRWKPTSRIFKSVSLRWILTGKLFDTCTSKVDSEPTHGSNVDIPNIHEYKQTLDVITEMESLFGPFLDEYFNGENQVVSKSSAVITAGASIKCQQQQDSTSSTSTLPTTITADGNFDLHRELRNGLIYLLDIVGCTMVSLRSPTLSRQKFCLHRMVYEYKYYKSCMGDTCNMRIDMTIAMLTKVVTVLFTWNYV
nr:hypothetical protein [Tanacetum cinerariifolium]